MSSIASSPTFFRISDGAAKSFATYEFAGGPLSRPWNTRSRCVITFRDGEGSPKHVVDPVWHAGPCDRTFASRASRSQSHASETTSWTLPDSSPFFQRRFRDRDQECIRPVASDPFTLSSFP